MLLITTICVLGLSLLMSLLLLKIDMELTLFEVLSYVGVGVLMLSLAALIIEVTALCIIYTSLPTDILRNDERAVFIQSEIDMLKIDTDDYTKAKVAEDIQKWNADLATGKYWSHNPWFGIFYPKALYDRYDPFEYPLYWGVLTDGQG